MRDLATELRTRWNERFLREFEADERQIKVLISPQAEESFRVIHSKKLEQWYFSPEGQKRYNIPKCFFCEEHDEYQVLEAVVQFAHLRVYYNIKFAARCHFLIAPFSEHREYPNQNDVTSLLKLALLSGLSIFGNFRDSGAGYPQHVHYQSLEIVFPIAERAVENIFSTDYIRVARIDYPVAAFRLSSVTKEGIELIAKAVPVLPHPYNLLFYGENIFLIPRTKSVPFNTGGFKFAAAEVCGVVFTRTREIYNCLDYQMMLTALKDVCIPHGGREAERFEERLIEILRGL
jgi:hypothetical protein